MKNNSYFLLFFLVISVFLAEHGMASSKLAFLGLRTEGKSNYKSLKKSVAGRTSLSINSDPILYESLTDRALSQPWLITNLSAPEILTEDGKLRDEIIQWIQRGGFLIAQSSEPKFSIERKTQHLQRYASKKGKWITVPPDHELMRSFYLLDALPACDGERWRAFIYDSRMAILSPPHSFFEVLSDEGQSGKASLCQEALNAEKNNRVFVNILMVALATDYKKDQIHLPEILKRLR